MLKYGRAVRAVVFNILGNPQDAEECQSDTYLQVWNSIPPARPDHLGAYVCRIARNVSLKRSPPATCGSIRTGNTSTP
ncbi:MAG: hypothetical protein IJO66_02570 [Clostridia bacterium]|nr:hypothetical protein [Clostridia bacterium]